jgi:tRNA (adenine22-N1)-methyltransferase
MKLSKRLLGLCSYVDKGAVIADVGSDHAQVPLYLFEQGIISKAEAIENKQGPFGRMSQAIAASPYASATHCSYSEGLSDLDSDVDTVILAGMGGSLVLKILQEYPQKLQAIKTIIVDAHTDQRMVREGLSKLSYSLQDEDFIVDGKIPYNLMKWAKSPVPPIYSEAELSYGPINLLKWTELFQDSLIAEKTAATVILEIPGIDETERNELLARIDLIDKIMEERHENSHLA